MEASTQLRRIPQQARSRARVERVLVAAGQVLTQEGAAGLTTTRVADAAGISVGSLYQYFPDKESIVEALALRYWSELTELVAAVAEADERDPLADPVGAVLDALVGGFRARPDFLALWYGGLRSEQVRDATRPVRSEMGRSLGRVLAVHWPDAPTGLRATVARMLVLIGDGLLREAFRLDPRGDATVLEEGRHALDAYLARRLEAAAA